MIKIRKPLIERFWPRVNKNGDNGCWNWTAALSAAGYGQIGAQGERKILYTHRLSWEIANGQIPNGMVICHKCDNPKCCNPDHLFMGTQKQNMQDARKKGRDVHSRHPNCFPIGHKAARAKITNEQASEMMKEIYGGALRSVTAKKFGVSVSLISKIINGKCRKHQI